MAYFRCKETDADETERGSLMQTQHAEDAAGDYVDEQILPRHADHDYAIEFDITTQQVDDDGNAIGRKQRFKVECEKNITARCVEELDVEHSST